MLNLCPTPIIASFKYQSYFAKEIVIATILVYDHEQTVESTELQYEPLVSAKAKHPKHTYIFNNKSTLINITPLL
jgi:hypothetical protein